MPQAKGLDFIKKSHQRKLAKSGEIFSSISQHEKNSDDINISDEERYSSAHSSMRHHMVGWEVAKFLLMRTLGNFLILLSLYGVVATFGPALYYEAQYQVIKIRGIRYNTVTLTPGKFETVSSDQLIVSPSFADVITGSRTQVLVPPDANFSIIIPKLGATARIWPNVDPLNDKEFLPKLQSGVAHAKGTVFPGMQGNVYLFAHSTDNFWDVGRYNAVFYMLKDMKPQDEISIYFENKRYNYVVDQTVIKDPSDVEFLKNSQVLGQEQLVLQTCWPPGTTWKRLFVIAKPQRMK